MKSASEVIETMRVLYGFKTLTELSIYFEKNGNWAAQMGKRGGKPYPQCEQACLEKGVSMDWLLFGAGEKKPPKPTNRTELINNLKESFYECWELDLLPDYPTEIMPAIASLFAKNLEDLIEVSKDKKTTSDNKKRAI